MPVFGTRLTTSIWIGPTSLKLNRQPPDAGELCEHSLRVDDFSFQLACTEVKRGKEEGSSIPMLICMTYTSCNWLCMEARFGGYCCCALPSMRQQSNPVSGTQLCVDFTSTCAVCSAIALLVCLAVCSFDHERCGFRFMELVTVEKASFYNSVKPLALTIFQVIKKSSFLVSIIRVFPQFLIKIHKTASMTVVVFSKHLFIISIVFPQLRTWYASNC